MKPSTVLVGVTLAALTPGCAASTEPTEEDLAFMAELREPAPPPPPVASPTVTPKAGVVAKKGGSVLPDGDDGCPPWACGSNHNRRIVRLATERT
jgi:hypothetical protein